MNNKITPLQRILGYLGLIPFIALSLAVVFDVSEVYNPANVLNLYAFGIGSFMLGSWWRIAACTHLQNLLSNLLFLVLFFSLVFSQVYFPLIAALIFTVTYFIEQHTQLINVEQGQYRRFRAMLTSVVVICMLVAFFGAP